MNSKMTNAERRDYLDLEELKCKVALELEDEKELAALRTQSELAEVRAKVNGKPDQQPIIWHGTIRSWGEWVLKAYEDGNIKATSRSNALELLAPRFHKDGKPMNPKAVLQNLRNKRDEGK